MPDLSVWVPVLWDNGNNMDIVYLDDKRHTLRRFSVETTRFQGSRLPWARIEDVKNALAQARSLAT